MKRFICAVFLLFAAIAVQGNIPNVFSFLGAKPDLVLVVLVLYSLGSDPIVAAVMGLVAGVVEGFAVGTSLGSFAFTRMLTGLVAGFCSVHLFSENLLVPAATACLLTALCEGTFLLANPQVATQNAWQVILGESVLNGCVTALVYGFTRIADRRRKVRLIDARIY